MDIGELETYWEEQGFKKALWPEFKALVEEFYSNSIGYRKITVTSLKSLKKSLAKKGKWFDRNSRSHKGAGECWSFTEEAAMAHWGYDSEHQYVITLKAWIPPSSVNWKQTASRFNECLEKWGTEELEIFLFSGAPLTVVTAVAGKILSREEQTNDILNGVEREDIVLEGPFEVEA